jgi:RNA polymerase sigma-70 factor (sigma-E family)
MIEWPRAGRAAAEFERFVGGAAAELLRTAYLIVWDLAEAEDLVQECLLRVARRWPRVRSMDHPIAYARRVLINLALDSRRRHSRRQHELNGHYPEDLADEASEQQLGRLAVQSELITALGTLGPRQRAVLVLRYFVDLPETEVAAALGCSLGTVKSTASRALARLAVQLQPEAPISQQGVTQDDRAARS